MPDPDRDDAPTTPPVAFRPERTVPPVSGTRTETAETTASAAANSVEASATHDTQLSVTEPSGRDPDTLMSLPKPALHEELPFETRLRQLEDRLEAFEVRLAIAERQRDPLIGGRATPWWFWLLFLAGLAVTWRVLEALR